jgi:drug/metabolite transporter (DMT)-like permease
MNTLGLYLTSVLIWGSTWLVITYQFGPVPPAVSVAYRFALSGLLLFAWCRIRGLRLRFSRAEHLWMLLQGILLFGLNYVCVYLAETEVTSGLVAVAFSLVVFLNIAGTRIFFRTPVKPATLLGAVAGVSGIVLVFLPEFNHGSGTGNPVLGLVLALVGAVSASLGNMVASRNHRYGLPVVQMNTYGMLYGALLVAGYALAAGQAFTFDWSTHYLLSLGYLAVFGSIVAFGAFLTLLGRIGADRAGYVTVAIPVVALLFSGLFEGLHWYPSLIVGVLLCLAGNVVVLAARPAPAGNGARDPDR